MGQIKKYRYRMDFPKVDFDDFGFSKVHCDIESVDWEKLNWKRFGSGGDSDARHCFVDDWRIEHLWRRYGQGLAKAIIQGVMTAPDFTIEKSFPAPVALYQIWRSTVICNYWKDNGVVSVPVLQWGNEDSWCYIKYAIEKGSVVAVRGPQRGTENEWAAGAEYMQKILAPSLVLHFGRKMDLWKNVIFYNLR